MTMLHLPASLERKCVDLRDLLTREMTALGVEDVESAVEAVVSQVVGHHTILVGGHHFVDQGRNEMDPPGPYVVPL